MLYVLTLCCTSLYVELDIDEPVLAGYASFHYLQQRTKDFFHFVADYFKSRMLITKSVKPKKIIFNRESLH